MRYFVLCTFDLKNADSLDYQLAYADLSSLGLNRTIVSDSGGNVTAPTTTVMGKWEGQSAADVRGTVCDQVKAKFIARGFKSEIFVLVGGDWAWGGRTT